MALAIPIWGVGNFLDFKENSFLTHFNWKKPKLGGISRISFTLYPLILATKNFKGFPIVDFAPGARYRLFLPRMLHFFIHFFSI